MSRSRFADKGTASARRAEPIGPLQIEGQRISGHSTKTTKDLYRSHCDLEASPIPKLTQDSLCLPHSSISRTRSCIYLWTSTPYNYTISDHVLCLHAFLLQFPAILASRETVRFRDHLTGGPQLPTVMGPRVHAPIPMISTATRVEDGNLPASLRVAPRLLGMDQEVADSYRKEEDF